VNLHTAWDGTFFLSICAGSVIFYSEGLQNKKILDKKKDSLILNEFG